MNLVVLVIIAAVVLIYCVSIYNSLIQKRVEVDNSWSQIDIQLKRRHDLIPNLIETVKGYSAYERETLERVIKARNTAISAAGTTVKDQAAAEGALSGALKQFFALSENYPDLKANQNFLSLQEELTSTENRIGFARQHYNDSVATYNASIQKVPNNFIASFGNFTKRDFFELDATEAAAVKEVPKVSF